MLDPSLLGVKVRDPGCAHCLELKQLLHTCLGLVPSIITIEQVTRESHRPERTVTPRPSYRGRAPTGHTEEVIRQPLALGLLTSGPPPMRGLISILPKRRMGFRRSVLQHTGECDGRDSSPSTLARCYGLLPALWLREEQTPAPGHLDPFELSLSSTRIRAN